MFSQFTKRPSLFILFLTTLWLGLAAGISLSRAQELLPEIRLGSAGDPDGPAKENPHKGKGAGNETEEESFTDEDVFKSEGGPDLEKLPEIVSLAPGLRLNIDDCIRMALLNNNEIRASDYGLMNAENKLKEAQIRGIPNLDYEFLTAPAPRDVDNAVDSFFSGDVTYFQRGKFTLGIPLYAFGKISILQNLARQGISAEKEKGIQKRNDIVLKVNQLYYGILLAKDMRHLLKDAVGHMETEINRREEEREGGEQEPRNPVELARLKLYRFEILSRLAKLEKEDLLAQHALRIQMGLPRETEYEITERHLNPVEYELRDFDTYLNKSMKFRPESKLLEVGLRAKEAQYRLEKRKAAPNIGIGGLFEFGVTTNSIQGLQLTDDFNDPFNFSRVGFGLRLDGTFNYKRYFAKVRQARAEYFKVAFNKRAADQGLELDIRGAYLTVVQNKKNMDNAREAMKTARQYVFLTKTNVDIGIGEKKDYSDALQAYLLSRGRYYSAIYDYNIAVATLEQKSGGVAQIKEEMR